MQLALELIYQDRYDITTEQHITNAINALNQAKRERQDVSRNVCFTVAHSAIPPSSDIGEINVAGRDGWKVVDVHRCTEGDASRCRLINNGRVLEEKYNILINELVWADPTKKPKVIIQ